MQSIRGIVFDLDGTLVAEQHDYEAIRRELGFPAGMPLLEGVEQLPADRQAAVASVQPPGPRLQEAGRHSAPSPRDRRWPAPCCPGRSRRAAAP